MEIRLNNWLCWLESTSATQAERLLGATDVQSERLALLKFTVGLSASVHTETHRHFDLQREMSPNEGQ